MKSLLKIIGFFVLKGIAGVAFLLLILYWIAK